MKHNGTIFDTSDGGTPESFLAAIVESSADAIVGKNLEGTILSWNRAAERMFGYTAREAVGKPIALIIPDERLEDMHTILDTVGRGGKVDRYETQRITKDGRILDVELSVSPILDEQGTIVGASKICRDITEQKRAHREIAALHEDISRKEEAFRLFANAMPHIAWSVDQDGRLTFLNARYQEFTGRLPHAELRENRRAVIHPDDVEAAMAELEERMREGEPFEQEFRIRRHDGVYRWFLSRLVPQEEDGKIVRWLGTSTDIHEKKEAHDSLQVMNAELEHRVAERTAQLVEANRELQGFTQSVSHDLRAPLRSIMSTCMMLIEDFEDQLPEEATKLLRRQAAAAKQLSSIIDDLLAYSRIGRKEIEKHPVSLSKMANEISAEISKRHPGRHVEWRIAPDLTTLGDPNLVRMLLQNLLDNAFKFTSKTDGARIEFGADDKGFFVCDNGVGFDMQHAEKLFKPFERLHRDVDYSGTGIGLANVKRIVQRHGGHITAKAEPDRGACFHFTLGE